MFSAFSLDPETLVEQAQQAQRAGLLAAGLDRVPTGQTPREAIWTKNKSTLYHYLPQREERYRTPILIIYALINRPYILDLLPGASFVEHLVQHGFEVYMLDWGDWGPEDHRVSIDDLVLDYIPRAVQRVRRHAGVETISLFGYCIGGILTTIYSALHPQAPLRNVLFLASPVDFAHAGLFGCWLDPRYFHVDRLVDGFGNVPGELIETGAKMLRPVTNYVTPYVNLARNRGDHRFFRSWAAMHQWVHDRVDFPGAAFRQLVGDLYQQNRLIRGTLRIGRQPVHVESIHWPALVIMAERDHITPLGSTMPLYERISSQDKHKLVIPAGHVGLVAGRGAVNDLWPKVVDWLAPHSA